MKKSFACTITLVASLMCLVGAMNRNDPFNDTKYKVEMTSADDNVRDKELTLVFKGGKFIVVEWEKRGFTPANYEEDTRRGGVGSFKAEVTSSKEGTAKWSGTVTGPQMKGEMQWTKADGSTVNYMFSGEKVQK